MAKGTLHLNVEFSAVTDEEGKFGRLAKLLGLADADHALGRCTHLWLACTRRGEAELPQWLVEQVLGDAGPDALVEAELATWAGGRGDSKTRRLRIGGAAKHCLWMVSDQAAKHEQSSKGGKTRAATASRAGGRFTSVSPAEQPAQTSPSEISSATDLEDQKLSPACDPAVPVPHQQHVPRSTTSDGGNPGIGESGARANSSAGGGHVRQGATAQGADMGAGNVAEPQTIPTAARDGSPPPDGHSQPPPTVQDLRMVPDEPGEYDPGDPRARGRLAERIYLAVSDARIAVAAELGLPAQLPFPPIAPSTSAGSFRDLRDRVREEGANAPVVCWRIVANLQAQAREDKSLEWLGEKAFREGSWRSAREWLPAAHRPRAGPKGSAERANTDPKIGRIEPPPASAFRGGIRKL